MTPAINLAIQHNIPHKIYAYEHDANYNSFGMEAAEKLNVSREKVFKTLVAQTNTKELIVAIIPVTEKLNMKLLAKAAHVKKAEMADKKQVENTTGYLLGGVSPIAQKRSLKGFIDSSATSLQKMMVSAGKRGLEIELAPCDLKSLIRAEFVPLCL